VGHLALQRHAQTLHAAGAIVDIAAHTGHARAEVVAGGDQPGKTIVVAIRLRDTRRVQHTLTFKRVVGLRGP
jgi:hypothetical protein